MPVNAAGWRIEPPVSVPVAPRQRCAATAVAEPPDEPPGTTCRSPRFRRHGEATGPNTEVSFDEPIANSSSFVFPSMIAPSRQRLAVTVDSYGGTKFLRIALHAVVGTFLVQNMSFTAIGMPSRGPTVPEARLASAASAILRAKSGVSHTKALRRRACSIAVMQASVSSRAENSFLANPARAAAIVSSVKAVIAYSTTLGTTK